jgi:Integrase core domain
MSNVLSEEKKRQVIALGKLRWRLRRIEQATGVRRRETASAYLKAAGVVVRLPRFWGKRIPAKPANEVAPDREAKPAKEVTPDFITPFSAKPAIRSTCEAYRELIEQGLALGRNCKAIWQDLVSDHGFAGDYQAVKRFVRKLRGPRCREAAGIIVTAPGEEAQVDYGSGPMLRDPQSGKYRRTRLFVLTLGYSRKCVRLLTWRSSVHTWAELHEKAFRRLGGCPKLIVLDNLKEGVAVSDLYDPTVNPLFRDVLAHYGFPALPCRIQDPDRKDQASYCTSSDRFEAS